MKESVKKPKEQKTSIPTTQNTSVVWFANSVRKRSSTFPRKNLGKFILEFKKRAPKPYLLDAKGKVKLEQIDTLEKYIKTLFYVSKCSNVLSKQVLSSVLENAIFWVALEARYSYDELILIQLSQLACTQCIVLYTKDMQPKKYTEYQSTQISTGVFVNSTLKKKK